MFLSFLYFILYELVACTLVSYIVIVLLLSALCQVNTRYTSSILKVVWTFAIIVIATCIWEEL